MDVSESSPAIHQLRGRSAQKPELSPVTVRQLGLQREFWVPWFSRLSCSRSKSVNQRRKISLSRGKLKATFCRCSDKHQDTPRPKRRDSASTLSYSARRGSIMAITMKIDETSESSSGLEDDS